MLYTPPDQWEESDVRKLSGEDDRYEFKSGGILFNARTQTFVTDDELVEKLSTEICAFANSFGGTLFLGITNENKKVDGVLKYFKSPSNDLKEWLDKKIAHMLEFRLPDYRVSEVKLTAATAKSIGPDMRVLAIDVPDSDLAPHQCRHNHKYYYRQSSNSNPAPHHYLAYLWSKTSHTQAETVQMWCVAFLNQQIDMLYECSRRLLSRNHFNFGIFDHSPWQDRLDSLPADQFLRTFPAIAAKLRDFINEGVCLQEEYKDVESSVKVSSKVYKALRATYLQSGTSGLTEKQIADTDIQTIANWVCQVDGFAATEEQGLETIRWLLAHRLLEAKNIEGINEFQRMVRYGTLESIYDLVKKDKKISLLTKKVLASVDALASRAENLAQELATFRYELCLKHKTNYFQK